MSALVRLVLIFLGIVVAFLVIFGGGFLVVNWSRSEIEKGIDKPNSEKMTEEKITWEEAVELIRNCGVTSVFQDHNKNVSITLTDETTRSTTEPELDLVLSEAAKASDKCEIDILSVTE